MLHYEAGIVALCFMVIHILQLSVDLIQFSSAIHLVDIQSSRRKYYLTWGLPLCCNVQLHAYVGARECAAEST